MLLLPVSSATAVQSAAARHRCPAVRTAVARGPQSILFVRGTRLYGCLQAVGRSRLVFQGGEGFNRLQAQPAALAGHYAAAAVVSSGPLTDQRLVALANLRTGVVHYWAANFNDSPVGTVGADVPRVVLTRTGTVAWTTNAPRFPGNAYHVEAVDRRNRDWVVDDEPGIDPRSLRLAGQRLTWTVAGSVRSATLP